MEGWEGRNEKEREKEKFILLSHSISTSICALMKETAFISYSSRCLEIVVEYRYEFQDLPIHASMRRLSVFAFLPRDCYFDVTFCAFFFSHILMQRAFAEIGIDTMKDFRLIQIKFHFYSIQLYFRDFGRLIELNSYNFTSIFILSLHREHKKIYCDKRSWHQISLEKEICLFQTLRRRSFTSVKSVSIRRGIIKEIRKREGKSMAAQKVDAERLHDLFWKVANICQTSFRRRLKDTEQEIVTRLGYSTRWKPVQSGRWNNAHSSKGV